MSTGLISGLVIGGGAFSAASQITGANQQAKAIQQQADYNAQIYEQQASMVLEKKKIQEYQFNREAARVRGSIISRAAGKGFNLGGSPLAILVDNETQMQFDQAINNYNMDVERNFALSSAANTRSQGQINASLTKAQGRMNAFSTALNTVGTYGLMNLKSPLAQSKTIYRPTNTGRTYKSPYGNTYRY